MWATILGLVLVITFSIWRWRHPRKGNDHGHFSTDGSVINTVVSGEERIRRMPGPGNQPHLRNLVNSAVDDISRTYQEWTGSGFHQSLEHSRNPQARTRSSGNDDPEDEVSTAHVPGKHPPGVRCDVCKPMHYRSDERNTVLLASKPLPPGAPPLRAAPPSKPVPFSHRHRSFGVRPEAYEEGTGEANYTFSTFNVRPADSDDSSG